MGIFEKIKGGLSKTRAQLQTQIEWIVKGKTLDDAAFDAIEEAVILADVGIETAEFLVGAVKERWRLGQVKTEEELKRAMIVEVEKILLPCEKPLTINQEKPYVILMLGVNGVGKTTTIAKLANLFLQDRKKILFGACDTFRAAAIEQLEVWAGRLGIEVIKHKDGSDPAAVAYDATLAARARGVDVLFLDTAGRLHTKVNLMEEMKKIKRVVQKEMATAPQETLLVVDATNGQNAIMQARTFHDALTLTGIVVTKLDGTAKGGFLLPIAHTIKLPIRFVGVGEKMDDLIPFRAKDFATAMFE
jgi:fused signal recognition particle receptor